MKETDGLYVFFEIVQMASAIKWLFNHVLSSESPQANDLGSMFPPPGVFHAPPPYYGYPPAPPSASRMGGADGKDTSSEAPDASKVPHHPYSAHPSYYQYRVDTKQFWIILSLLFVIVTLALRLFYNIFARMTRLEAAIKNRATHRQVQTQIQNVLSEGDYDSSASEYERHRPYDDEPRRGDRLEPRRGDRLEPRQGARAELRSRDEEDAEDMEDLEESDVENGQHQDDREPGSSESRRQFMPQQRSKQGSRQSRSTYQYQHGYTAERARQVYQQRDGTVASHDEEDAYIDFGGKY
jgi:hypothetical protein